MATTQVEPRSGLDLLKRLLVGRRLASHRLEHTLLPKVLALPVFSSDALSSVAYATGEIMVVLYATTAAANHLVLPVSLAIAALLLIVVASYRQTVRAYPSGGGAYIVAKDNLGTFPGLIAAAALLIDYVLTVSVSVVAGVFAITSIAPSLQGNNVGLSVGFVVLITLANLRGVKESGTLFAIPTYGFIVSILVLLIAGLGRCVVGSCAQAVVPDHTIEIGAAAGASLFVILHAFSSGSTALTGVEAISNGVPAFRRPQSRNAATTLAIMGAISVTMFLGISFLAQEGHAIPSEAKSVVAQIADGVFRGGFLLYVVQVFTAAILVLAANTSYQDFPRLSSILARDRFLPAQFENRGDRLVFSNGVILLALVSSALIWVFQANLSKLIQLYVVGVFTSFTLSQAGMVRHWLKIRRELGDEAQGWRRSIVINAVGAIATFVVLLVVVRTKFTEGAWIVIAAMPVIIAAFYGVHRHYQAVTRQLGRGAVSVAEPSRNVVILYVENLDAAVAEAVGYVRSFAGRDFRAVHVRGPASPWDIAARWRTFSHADVDLEILEATTTPHAALIEFIRAIPRGPDDFVTVAIPELLRRRSLLAAVWRPAFRLKVRLLREPGVVIADIPVLEERGVAVGVDARPLIPTRVEAMVFVSSASDAAVRAINYARSTQASALRAVYFALDPTAVERIQEDWARRGIPVQLDIVEAPFRDLGPPILEEIGRVTRKPDSVASVIIPELIVRTWWHHLLHNQRALFIKRLLLFEPRTILSSVPYQLQ